MTQVSYHDTIMWALAHGGGDSARRRIPGLHRREGARPGSFHLWPQTLRAAAEEIAQAGKPDAAAEILRWCRDRWAAEAACMVPLPEPRTHR